MRQAKTGYTIVEVMIVLAISGLLLAATIAMFKGRRGGTEFTQAMYDINSKIQSYVNDVSVSTFPDAQNYTCSTGSDKRPLLSPISAGPKETGTNQDCIFLGKALQVDTGATTMSTYTVLGNRLDLSGGGAGPSVTFSSAMPTPVVNYDSLIEKYGGGFNSANLQWSRLNTSTDPALMGVSTNLVGFYNSLQGSTNQANQTGGQSLLVKAYTGLPSSPTLADVKDCIQETTCTPVDIKGWYLCFVGRSTSDSAILAVSSTPSGVTTRLLFKKDLTPNIKCPA